MGFGKTVGRPGFGEIVGFGAIGGFGEDLGDGTGGGGAVGALILEMLVGFSGSGSTERVAVCAAAAASCCCSFSNLESLCIRLTRSVMDWRC